MPSKNLFLFLSLLVFSFFCSGLLAQDSTSIKNKDSNIQHGQHFIDEDGDGYNDNAPDHDNDGVPNGLDPDWKKEQGQKGKRNRWRYIDLDGDGINDNIQDNQTMETADHRQGDEQRKGSSIGSQEKAGGEKQRKRKGPNH